MNCEGGPLTGEWGFLGSWYPCCCSHTTLDTHHTMEYHVVATSGMMNELRDGRAYHRALGSPAAILPLHQSPGVGPCPVCKACSPLCSMLASQPTGTGEEEEEGGSQLLPHIPLLFHWSQSRGLTQLPQVGGEDTVRCLTRAQVEVAGSLGRCPLLKARRERIVREPEARFHKQPLTCSVWLPGSAVLLGAGIMEEEKSREGLRGGAGWRWGGGGRFPRMSRVSLRWDPPQLAQCPAHSGRSDRCSLVSRLLPRTHTGFDLY